MAWKPTTTSLANKLDQFISNKKGRTAFVRPFLIFNCVAQSQFELDICTNN